MRGFYALGNRVHASNGAKVRVFPIDTTPTRTAMHVGWLPEATKEALRKAQALADDLNSFGPRRERARRECGI